LIVAILVYDLVGLQLNQLLVGGAITGIILGLAAQPVLTNLFAGLVLPLLARPYVPGQRVRVMSGALNGPYVGVIVSAGLLYTVLETDDGPLNIPNLSLLGAAVGPAPTKPELADLDTPERTPSDPTAPTQDGATLSTIVVGGESAFSANHHHTERHHGR
jgi:hypothetical protein